jgi:hypothetical protein
MKYVLMFGGTPDQQQAYENLSEAERTESYRKVGQWFEAVGGRYVYGHELQSPSMTTTVRFDAKHQATVTDGPFVEGKEVIGGFAVIDVADLDEALRLAKAWPGSSFIEVRPIIPHE